MQWGRLFVQWHGFLPRVTWGLQEIEIFEAMLANEPLLSSF